MMNINSATKVRDVALELPQSTRVFEKFNIDYCCGGDQPLGEACSTAGVDFQNLMQLIDQLRQTPAQGNGAPDLQKATLAEVIGYILDNHHVYTKEAMARLEPQADKVVAAHSENHSELLAIRDLLQQLFAELKQHMFKEEQILFPFVIEMERSQTQNRRPPFAPFGTVNNPISMMMMEHDAAGEILREVRKLSADYKVPPDACISYKSFYETLEAFEQDLHHHIHLENNLLFPKAVELETNLS